MLPSIARRCRSARALGPRVLGAWGCAASAPELVGSWRLDGDGVEGFIEASPGGACAQGGVRVGLWGPTWGTPGVVQADVELAQDGLAWLSFPLETGVGEGGAVLRLQGATAMVPLGGRRGEHEVHLRATEAPPPPDRGAAADAAARTRLAAEQAAWAQGSFRLEDGDQLVGELQLRGDALPLVQVYDATWWSAGPVEAQRKDDGGDLLLAFPVQPSLGGEGALLRINVPSRQVVVPLDALPQDEDRKLVLTPGTVSADARAAAVHAARAAASSREREWLEVQLPRLAAEAAGTAGDCRPIGDLDPAWTLLLKGYALSLEPSPAGCRVRVEPEPPQHGRRWRMRADAGGVLEAAEMD